MKRHNAKPQNVGSNYKTPHMRRLLFLISLFFIYSCKTENKATVLLNINHVNKLEFLTVDDKCGEWGGNEKQIIFYRDSFQSQLLADYIEKTKDCGSGNEPKVTKSVKRIKVSEEESKLIIETINELCENKLSREDFPAHSGIYNRIMLSDSSMIIQDFPSVELKKFNKLTKEIQQK